MPAGKLYIVCTPIGNLEDITLRALRVLKEADIIAAEDTRVTRKLLSHFDIHTPATPYHQHSKGHKAQEIAEMIEAGKNVALVSDAGTPGISDPGHELISNCIDRGVDVVFVPGANAIIMALVVSGLSTNRFVFDGFPPRREGERKAFFRSLKDEQRTMIFYESPLRLVATLKSAFAELGDRRVAILREATKVFEEVFRGSLSRAIDRFTSVKPKGEVTIVIEGLTDDTISESRPNLEERLRELLNQGFSERDAVRHVREELGVSHRQAYSVALQMKRE